MRLTYQWAKAIVLRRAVEYVLNDTVRDVSDGICEHAGIDEMDAGTMSEEDYEANLRMLARVGNAIADRLERDAEKAEGK